MTVITNRFGPTTGWIWLLLWLLLESASPGRAQTAAGRDDRSAVRVRTPQADQLRQLQTDRAYRYDNEPPPPDNPIARFFAYYAQKLLRLFSGKAYDNFWKYAIPVAVIGLVFYLLRKANYLGFLFPPQSQADQLLYESSPEDIDGIDFSTAIAQAIDSQQYRVAVRLLYLQTLKRLTDAELIRYQREKTNRQYVYELAGSPHQADFEQLTRQFDYVWYGNTTIDSDQFATIQTAFRAFVPRNTPHSQP